jgi:hypothetical protein
MKYSVLSLESTERNAIALFRQSHCIRANIVSFIRGEIMKSNRSDDEFQFDDDELRNDAQVDRRPAKATFLGPLQTRNQTTEEPCVTPQEREAERLKQCRAAGRQGGRTRSEHWAPVREFARSKAVENRKSSTAKIAHAAAEEVVDYARQLGIEMSPTNAIRTISNWIRNDKKSGPR